MPIAAGLQFTPFDECLALEARSAEQPDRNERFVLFQQVDSLEEYALARAPQRPWHSLDAAQTLR